MKIALIGYGKMGKIIHELAEKRGHEIVAKFSRSNPLNKEELQKADVAIEFTQPDAALDNIHFCIDSNIPVVVGTTGWFDQIATVEGWLQNSKSAVLYASNFSVGVNIFFELNKQLAKMMSKHANQYGVMMEEIHHTQKLDSPSGTAISLAQGIVETSNYETFQTIDSNEGASYSTDKKDFPIYARRIPEVPGTHTIEYESEIDGIRITHTAHNRLGFASGSIDAAEFLHNKTGLFTMKDVLNFD